MNPLILTGIQIIVIVFIAPLSFGLVRFFRARLQGRKGAHPLLPYVSLATLMRKQMVISNSTSWLFRATPFVVVGSGLFLSAVLPLVARTTIFASFGNFIVVAGVLALGAVFLVFGGLDGASAFGGMGASREMTLAALVEPAMIMVLATFAIVSHRTTVEGMLQVGGAQLLQAPYLGFSLIALILILLVENARYPVDNPATHLELTMVHEAMILEYSGPYLAIIEYASALKLTVFSLILANMVAPQFLLGLTGGVVQIALAILITVVKLVVILFLLAVLETSIAKMRFFRMQEFLTGTFAFALVGMIFAIIHVVL